MLPFSRYIRVPVSSRCHRTSISFLPFTALRTKLRAESAMPVGMASPIIVLFHLFLYLRGWSWINSIIAAAIYWPTQPVLYDIWWWLWSNSCNEWVAGKPKYSEKTCPSAALFTIDPTWFDRGSKAGRRGGKPATRRLSLRHGLSQLMLVICMCWT
jgi:hypothetical protein